MPVLLFLLWISVLSPLESAPAPPADISRLEAEKNLGLAALEQGEPGEARRRFEAVRRLAPAQPLGWSRLSRRRPPPTRRTWRPDGPRRG